jgi:hypothetical protein
MNPNPYLPINILYGYTAEKYDDLCELCATIPFARLPNEDEAAYPHQPNIPALEASASKCRLCLVVSFAVKSFKEQIAFEKSHGIDKVPVTWKAALPPEITSSNIPTFRFMGWNSAESSEQLDLRHLRQNSEIAIRNRTDHESNVERPWIYGNWWIFEIPQAFPAVIRYQLIGIGVRLTECIQLISTKTSQSSLMIQRGSSIRICVDHGKQQVDSQMNGNLTPLQKTRGVLLFPEEPSHIIAYLLEHFNV